LRHDQRVELDEPDALGAIRFNRIDLKIERTAQINI